METLTRDHKHRDLYFADAATGQARQMLQISDDKFIDDNYDVSVGFGSIVLTNWTSGHNHLYLYSYNQSAPMAEAAKQERQLTNGDFDVAAVATVDHPGKLIRYESNEGNVLEAQLWQVSFDGERKQLSSGAGYHSGNFAPTGTAFVDRQSTRTDTAHAQPLLRGGQVQRLLVLPCPGVVPHPLPRTA